MESMHYIGLDIHKKIVVFCIKTFGGIRVDQGTIRATRKGILGTQ